MYVFVDQLNCSIFYSFLYMSTTAPRNRAFTQDKVYKIVNVEVLTKDPIVREKFKVGWKI